MRDLIPIIFSALAAICAIGVLVIKECEDHTQQQILCVDPHTRAITACPWEDEP